MAATPIELALSSLLPTISFLPPELIHLATSLLAQSRSKAASLKPEEEIARTYACAHIAAERLAKQLDLELGDARPPCKPRVYVKLKGYLDGVLVNQGRRTPTGTPRSRQNVKTPTPMSGVKRKTPEDASMPALPPAEPVEGKEEVPEFVMPLIRAICKSCAKPAAVPHVNVGAMAVVQEIASRNVKRAMDTEPAAKRRRSRTTPQRREETPVQTAGEAIEHGRWPALLVALFVFTAARMEGLGVEEVRVGVLREKAVKAVKGFCEDGRRVLPEGVRACVAGDGEELESSIRFYMLEAEDCGWLEMEWFANVPEGEVLEEAEGGQDGSQDEVERGPVTPRRKLAKTPLRRKEKRGGKRDAGLEDEALGAAGLAVGLGTMFQPAVDWLSEERRAEYAVWREDMLREIVAVEQGV